MSPATDSVVLAMSGGVDSSVAAAVLVEAGWKVSGVFFRGAAGAAAAPGHAADARRVAETIGIELREVDMPAAFQAVIDAFVTEYARGRTPNPCLRCNRLVKFPALVAVADELGARAVATGHHARVAEVAGEAALLRGRDAGKDQSYALFALPRRLLKRLVLPIGEIADKGAVRERARRLGLDVHAKPDSQEICFVPDDDYVGLIRRRAPEAIRPGEIVNAAGEVLGTHEGTVRFTIGQRRGLGVAAGVPMYVTAIDAATGRVTIGPREQALATRLAAADATWHADVPEAFDATVQVRYNHAGQHARLRRTGPDTFDVEFRQPVHAVTPGQAAVCYHGDRLLGGGWIT